MAILVTGERGLSLACRVLAIANLPHVVVRTKKITRGSEVFDGVRLVQRPRVSFGASFASFCREFKLSVVPEILEDSVIYGQYKYAFANRSGSIVVWTQFDPMHVQPHEPASKAGYLGDVFIRVEDDAPVTFGRLRSGFRKVANIPPKFKRITREDVYEQLSLLLDEKLGYKPKN